MRRRGADVATTASGTDLKAPSGLAELGTGGAARVPTLRIAIVAGVLLVAAIVGVVTINPLVKRLDDEVSVRRLARCDTVPAAVTAALTAELHDLGDRVPRGWAASRAGADAGPRAGWWFVSVELAPPDLAKGATGDIVTWVVPDRGDGQGPSAAGGAEVVDRDGRRLTTSPHAPDGVAADDKGGVDSRWCAREVTRPT